MEIDEIMPPTGLPLDQGWARCRYFQFWDVPRALVVTRGKRTLLLESSFDEQLDDYTVDYDVWEIDAQDKHDVWSWNQLWAVPRSRLGTLAVSVVEFWPERVRFAGRAFAWWRSDALGAMLGANVAPRVK